MIKKLEVEDIAKILYLDDNVASFFPCEKGEWVQWLIQNVDNPDMFIVGVLENEKLTGYIVAANDAKPPLSDCVFVIFAHTAGLETNKEVLQMLIDWGKTKGAKAIEIVTKDVIGHSVYGFKKEATVMRMTI